MYVYVHEQSCPSLCNCMNCSLPGSSFSRQKNWNGLPFPSPGDLHNPEIESRPPALQVDSLLTEPPGKPMAHRSARENLFAPGAVVESLSQASLFFYESFPFLFVHLTLSSDPICPLKPFLC